MTVPFPVMEAAPETDTRRLRAGLWAGVIGPVSFVAFFLIEGQVRPGYDAMRLQVSYLSLGEGGWVQVLSFLASGGLLIAFAVALRRVLGGGAGSTFGPSGVGIAGTGLVIAGLFSTAPAFGYPPGTPDGFPTELPSTAYLHVLGAFCAFGGMILAPLAMARRFRREHDGRWVIYSVLSALVVWVFLAASSADPSGQPFFPETVGLYQRISIIAGLGWIAALAGRYLQRMAGAPATDGG
jgi:Protein of unknown function (DUF998)